MLPLRVSVTREMQLLHLSSVVVLVLSSSSSADDVKAMLKMSLHDTSAQKIYQSEHDSSLVIWGSNICSDPFPVIHSMDLDAYDVKRSTSTTISVKLRTEAFYPLGTLYVTSVVCRIHGQNYTSKVAPWAVVGTALANPVIFGSPKVVDGNSLIVTGTRFRTQHTRLDLTSPAVGLFDVYALSTTTLNVTLRPGNQFDGGPLYVTRIITDIGTVHVYVEVGYVVESGRSSSTKAKPAASLDSNLVCNMVILITILALLVIVRSGLRWSRRRRALQVPRLARPVPLEAVPAGTVEADRQDNAQGTADEDDDLSSAEGGIVMLVQAHQKQHSNHNDPAPDEGGPVYDLIGEDDGGSEKSNPLARPLLI